MEFNNDVIKKENLNKDNDKVENKKSKKKIWIIVGFLFIIIIGAIIVYAKITEDNCSNNLSNEPLTGGYQLPGRWNCSS